MMMLGIIILGIILYIFYVNDIKDKGTDGENDQLRCFNCGHPIEERYNYCPNCKEKLKDKCTNCGKMIGINWRYCPYCNHPNLDRKVDYEG